MDKQCKSCGANVPNEARFCQKCGGSDFYISNPQPNNAEQINNSQPAYSQPQYSQQPAQQYQQPAQQQYQQPAQQQYQQPAQQQYQQPAQQPNQPQPKKKKKTGLIIGIIASALVVLAAIGMVAEKVFQQQGYGDDYDDYINNSDYSYNDYDSDYENNVIDNSSEEQFNKVDYTKGTFNGYVYTNEWANIKFSLPAGYSNADASAYASAENSKTECGAYFVANNGTGGIFISYEKLPTFPVYDEKTYLDAVMNGLKSASGITYKTPSRYTTAVIGGNVYTKAECELNNGVGDFANTFYVRKLDGYMICISSISTSSAYNDILTGLITTVN